MRPLRFCHVTTFYPPYNFGGDGIAVQRLAEALAHRGHDVTVVHAIEAFNSLHEGPAPEPPSPAGGVHTIGLDSRLGTLSPLLVHQLGRPVVHRARLAHLLADSTFDVIHFHNVSLIGGPRIVRLGDAVKLYTAHEHWLVCPTHVLWRHDREPCDHRQCLRCVLNHRRPPQLWRWTSAIERNLGHVDARIALSEFSRRRHAEYGFTRAMEVLPCFAPDPWAESPSLPPVRRERPYVFYAGRLERMKGLDDVVTAFDHRLGVDLVLAGRGSHEPALRRLAGGNPAVNFAGWLAPDALAARYRDALAVIVPTVGYETFGQSVIEAFSHGVPVIARRTGPLPELIESTGGGELFEVAADVPAIVARLAADDAARRGQGARGRAAYEQRFCEDVVVPRYLDLVRRAAHRRGRSLEVGDEASQTRGTEAHGG